MKCISIRQPWAWLIVTGKKPAENRSWPSKYRGPLLIHAAQRFDRDGAWANFDLFEQLGINIRRKEAYDRGYIIGQVNMIDCVTAHPSPFFFGPYGFVLSDPVMFKEPIPYKGKLGIFNVPDEILPALLPEK